VRIRTDTLVVGGLLTVAAIWALAQSLSRTAAAVERNQALSNVFIEGMQLAQLTNEVLPYGEKRAIEQWRKQYAEVDRAVGAASSDQAAHRLVDRVATDVADMKPLFDGFVQGSARDDVVGILSSQLFQKATHMQVSLRNFESYAYDELQGYLLARPMPAADLVTCLSESATTAA
jgi:hypothetical protein